MDWEISFATYINPFPLFGCECFLVAAVAYSFSKSTRVSLTCKRYGSLLKRVSHLSFPSDGLSSFPQDTIDYIHVKSVFKTPPYFVLLFNSVRLNHSLSCLLLFVFVVRLYYQRSLWLLWSCELSNMFL